MVLQEMNHGDLNRLNDLGYVLIASFCDASGDPLCFVTTEVLKQLIEESSLHKLPVNLKVTSNNKQNTMHEKFTCYY
jgi:hypothetical protein